MDLTGMTDDDDRTLATAWVAGDERAYERIVARHAPMVWRRCRRGLDAADADDATQAVFLVLARRRDKAAASPVLAAWLLTVADMVVRNAHRDRDRRRRAERAAPPPEPQTESTMTDIQDAFRHHLDASLAELPDREREAVVLHHLAGRSLAQVAQATGAGLSTVKERLQRGLDRLRRSLASRGVALGGTALLSCLAAEAAEMPPAGLLVRLRDPASSTAGPGATAGPAANALRWSREGLSPMSRLAIAASITLLAAGSAGWALSAADPAAELRRDPRLGTPSAFDPDHAAQWTVVDAPDLPRTVARLRALPEAALLTPEAAAWLEDLGRIQAAQVALDQNLILGRRLARMAMVIERDIAAVPPLRRSRERKMRLEAVIGTTASGSDLFGDQGFLAAVHARIEPGSGARPVLDRWLDAAVAARAISPVDGGWVGESPFPPGDAIRFRFAGQHLEAGTPHAGAPGRILATMPLGRFGTADLVMTSCLDPGIVGLPLATTATAALTILPDGPRLVISTLRDEVEHHPGWDARALQQVPADAVLALTMTVRPGSASSSAIVVQLVRSLSGGTASPLTEAVIQAADRIDGTVVAWVEPMAPFPSLTIRADLDRAHFETLALALVADGGFDRDGTGTVSGLTGPVPLALAWADGQVIVTTGPEGIVPQSAAGGFLAHPEVAMAMAEMDREGSSLGAIVRPAAFTRSIAPLAGMALGGAWAQRLADYQQRQDRQPAPGYLTVHPQGGTLTIRAAGILAVGAAAVLGAQASEVRLPN
jgi:RNA polymerase sigma factor (sigma-70 family)